MMKVEDLKLTENVPEILELNLSIRTLFLLYFYSIMLSHHYECDIQECHVIVNISDHDCHDLCHIQT